jgi:hypothetical protein
MVTFSPPGWDRHLARSRSLSVEDAEEIKWRIKISLAKAKIAMEESMERLGRKLLRDN